jgi:uncharacterized protein (TIGR00255 family)
MTGFGKSACETGGKKVIVEIRSLNSKQLDINTKITSLYRDKEQEVRNMLARSLQRGKIDVSIFFDNADRVVTPKINVQVVRDYIAQLRDIADTVSVDLSGQILQTVMSLPEALKTEKEELSDEEWHKVTECIASAIKEVTIFRDQEGQALASDLQQRVHHILDLLKNTGEYEKKRLEDIRTRIHQNLIELNLKEAPDKDRFEQEMIYYLEKMDITEEKVRLKNHCDFFLETMDSPEAVGKKLGFISQEMGREINTLGSKASESNIQRLVVEMKDELEKIREQLLNIL